MSFRIIIFVIVCASSLLVHAQTTAIESSFDSLQAVYYKKSNTRAQIWAAAIGLGLGGPIGAFPTQTGNVLYAGTVGLSIPFISIGNLKRARRKTAKKMNLLPETAEYFNENYGEWRAKWKEERKTQRLLKKQKRKNQ